jgi:hypothetical protein
MLSYLFAPVTEATQANIMFGVEESRVFPTTARYRRRRNPNICHKNGETQTSKGMRILSNVLCSPTC